MQAKPLTPKQREVLFFVSSFIVKYGYAPTVLELCRGMGLSSTATGHKYLRILQDKGYLSSIPNRPRALRVVPDAVASLSALMQPHIPYEVNAIAAVDVPLLGRVAAGQPLEINEIPDTISLPESMIGRGPTFVLEVKGDSMIDEAIKDGDLVIIEKCETARNGDMVIACIDRDAVTLKRFYLEGDRVRLQPSNPVVPPIIVGADMVSIKGIVIGVMRKY